ncbi:HAD family hydrolase [Sphingosinicella rhizophila]|uniref:HAD family hydrolase n=1 Tax=Sphingosinicella rhizophila TaxID=3050082 RepID=A0ABU3Q7H4_9SPHN|nr:HAD family hydrolase [Sphingosinicella sp. GR2756]MDT9599277.1 HAD family hydrolase [Sphingosinicella sp. GR2756]
MKAALAIYDMDRTITRRATYTPFLIHAALRLAPWRLLLLPAVLLTTLAYGLKLIERSRLKEINYILLVGNGIAPERLEPVIASFAKDQVATNIMPGARRSIANDRAAGRRLVMATASYRIYAAAIAERLGFKDVIATETRIDAEGRILARIDGVNCYGDGKLAMIRAWLDKEGLTREAVHIRFYSDHVSDAPVHHWSDEAVAANAHDRLVRLARVEGWEIHDWSREDPDSPLATAGATKA